eukprot:TRINITY_DN19368_c0_g1_i1.p1 TRINITY_DN19368_c0_g1~~TRINITY_DN19368_c0_g1_i1.p1  ORF type:complete len:278 (-),score=57.20 TRINITY_DN19368_c0_g1_i1:206-1039(-)
MSEGEALLAELTSLVAEFNACGDDKDALAAVKPQVQEAVFALLSWISADNVCDGAIDAALGEMGAAVKWPLLRGLSFAHHHRAYLNLPQSMETTRKNLCSIPAKKANEIVGADLQADMLKSEADRSTFENVEEVLQFLTGAGRFKKDLGGVDLSTGLKNVCRASINKAKDGVLRIIRPGFQVHQTVHCKGAVAEANNTSTNASSSDVRANQGVEDTVAARKQATDVIASQNKGIKVSAVDTSAQAARLVGDAQKVPRCGICTMPMGGQSGNVCARCK